jgi:hypothetical protein
LNGYLVKRAISIDADRCILWGGYLQTTCLRYRLFQADGAQSHRYDPGRSYGSAYRDLSGVKLSNFEAEVRVKTFFEKPIEEALLSLFNREISDLDRTDFWNCD